MTQPILILNQVSFKLPTMEKHILENISYQMEALDNVVLLGGNGSGKSSLLKLICNQYKPSGGKINIPNYNSIKMLTQNCHESLFTSLTVMENFLIAYKKNSYKQSTRQLRNFFCNYISEFNLNLAEKLDSVVSCLSGGEKQALALALTVLYPPSLLLLDEHTSALDPKLANHIMELTFKVIKKYQITSIFITHDLTHAIKYGNRVLILNKGRIYKSIDNKDNLKEEDLLSAYH